MTHQCQPSPEGQHQRMMPATETVVLMADSTISSLKGTFLSSEPVEEAGSGI